MVRGLGHVVENAALDKRVYARFAEEDERCPIIIAAGIARDLPQLLQLPLGRADDVASAGLPQPTLAKSFSSTGCRSPSNPYDGGAGAEAARAEARRVVERGIRTLRP